jgi:hypothetical protein
MVVLICFLCLHFFVLIASSLLSILIAKRICCPPVKWPADCATEFYPQENTSYKISAYNRKFRKAEKPFNGKLMRCPW